MSSYFYCNALSHRPRRPPIYRWNIYIHIVWVQSSLKICNSLPESCRLHVSIPLPRKQHQARVVFSPTKICTLVQDSVFFMSHILLFYLLMRGIGCIVAIMIDFKTLVFWTEFCMEAEALWYRWLSMWTFVVSLLWFVVHILLAGMWTIFYSLLS